MDPTSSDTLGNIVSGAAAESISFQQELDSEAEAFGQAVADADKVKEVEAANSFAANKEGV